MSKPILPKSEITSLDSSDRQIQHLERRPLPPPAEYFNIPESAWIYNPNPNGQGWFYDGGDPLVRLRDGYVQWMGPLSVFYWGTNNKPPEIQVPKWPVMLPGTLPIQFRPKNDVVRCCVEAQDFTDGSIDGASVFMVTVGADGGVTVDFSRTFRPATGYDTFLANGQASIQGVVFRLDMGYLQSE